MVDSQSSRIEGEPEGRAPAPLGVLSKRFVGKFLRTAVDAVFAPRRFLEQWRNDVDLYLSPGKLLAIYCSLTTIAFYFANQGSKPMQEALAAAKAAGRAVTIGLDAWQALFPVVLT